MADALTLYKLIILKMLDQAEMSLTGAQISDFILGRDYTNYFSLQQTLSELEDSELITGSSARNSTLYHITEAGCHTLTYLGDKLSDAIRKDITAFLKEKQIELRNARSNVADYFPVEDGFLVRCQVREQRSVLIELALSVPTKEEAESICRNWPTKSQLIYAHAMKELL